MDQENDRALSDDMIVGADAIATFLGVKRRQVYNASERGYLPVFRLGALICARKTTLASWVTEQERASLAMRG
jgi:hypothetical protein